VISLKEAVIVEGRYDKIKLQSFVASPIIETGGFRVFKDKEKQNLIREIALKRGILVLTDSDGAGFVIRNFLRGTVPNSEIKHAYIPQLKGKEKRKSEASKEGFLGVEGISEEIIIDAIRKSGATIIGENAPESSRKITKADLFDLGLTGRENSAKLREKLLKSLNMPTYLTTNALLMTLNCIYSLKELKEILDTLSL
jgi:ribonuclease M5